jgi:hypothetical protein
MPWITMILPSYRTLRRAEIPIAKDSDCLAINSEFSNTKQICAGGEKGKKGVHSNGL